MKPIHFLILCIAAATVGCASHHAATPATRAASHESRPPTTAELALDDILPAPVLPKSPTTAATTQPAPVAALDLYAQARAAMLENRRFTAIALLEKAIQLDPYSFELYYSLGRASLQPGSPTDKAAAAYERAAVLDPTNIDVRIQLARIYINDAHAAKAIDHLRLALDTPDYRMGDDAASLVDLLLARALQQKGYDRAALDRYEILIDRLQHANLSIRSNVELLYLINRPEVLLLQIAQLEEKLGRSEEALHSYELTARRDPSNFDTHDRIVHLLGDLGRWNDAVDRAADTVRIFHASPQSLDLLRGIYVRMGRENAMADELSRLHGERPDDPALAFALADVLQSQGETTRAEAVLAGELSRQQYDIELVRRLFHLYQSHAQVEDAARLLIQTMAVNPDSLRETAPLWDEILRFSQKNRLRLTTLEKISVPADAQAAKLFWVSRVADLWNRDALARTALEQATKISPPLAPAFRHRIDQIWGDSDRSDAVKEQASQQLIAFAESQGSHALAEELRGLLLLREKKPDQAVIAFDNAMKMGRPSIDLQMNAAGALFQQGQTARGEQILWKLIGDFPTLDEPYQFLFQYYLNQRSGNEAFKVLQTWSGANPTSVNARILRASVALQAKDPAAAEKILIPLFEQNSDNIEVLNAMQVMYMQGGHLDQYVARLEQERSRHPQNRVASEQLVRLYNEQGRLADASRVLDAMRTAAAGDVDYLYYLSHLYAVIGQKEITEQILQEVLKSSPDYSSAANDLGFSWADDGKNLNEAESLIRLAVNAEPDNQSYLDSLGWVLYKKGEFAEASRYLQQAVDAAIRPDPIVLDHLGDALYRMDKREQAVKEWKRSSERMTEESADRDDLKALRLQLIQKLKQGATTNPVDVAPVVNSAATQVKK